MRPTDVCSYCGTVRGVRKDGRFTRHHRFVGRADAGLCPGSHPRIGDYCTTFNGSCLVGFGNRSADQ
jgi:hypothetical protein